MIRPLTTLRDWASHLRALALPPLRGTPLDPASAPSVEARRHAAENLRDEFGHRRPFDGHVVARRLRLAFEARPGDPPAALLWSMLTRGESDAAAVLGVVEADGPLTREDPWLAIEIWSEAELAALHAADHLARMSGDERLAARVEDAAAWHVESLQPDNATNRPWAAHVFARIGVEHGNAAAVMHAETLVSNCCVSLGRPDLFSAALLLDSAEGLEASLGARGGE